MTVPSSTNKIQYTGDNSTVLFTVPFPFFADSELEVTLTDIPTDVDTLQLIVTDYSVSGAGLPAGSITFVTAPTSNDRITIRRVRPFTQETDYSNADKLDLEITENDFDKTVMLTQQNNEEIARSIKLPPTSTLPDQVLPPPVAAQFLRWNTAADGLENASVVDSLSIPTNAADAKKVLRLDATGLLLEAGPEMDFDPVLGDARKLIRVNAAGAGLEIGNTLDGSQYAADTGVANAYVVTLDPVPDAYFAGMVVRFKAANRNIGPSTLDVNGQGTQAILRERGGALQGGEIETNGVYTLVHDGTQFQLENPAVPIGPIARLGLLLSRDAGDPAKDINITAGKIMDSTGVWPIILPSEITKQSDVDWTAGDDSGGFPSGLTLTADTWYHFFVIGKKSDPYDVDAGIDTLLNAANLLADATEYDIHARVLSVLFDSTPDLLPFQHKLQPSGLSVVQWITPIEDVDVANLGLSEIAYTLSVPAIDGTWAIFRANSGKAADQPFVNIHHPDVSSATPASSATPGIDLNSETSGGLAVSRMGEMVDGSGQIEAVSTVVNTIFRIHTIGWME